MSQEVDLPARGESVTEGVAAESETDCVSMEMGYAPLRGI